MQAAIVSREVMTARTLARLTRLEGRTTSLDSLSDADLDLCIAAFQRAIRRLDGELVPDHPDDDRADALIAVLRRAGAYL